GVRGPTWGSGTQSASECRGVFSPRETSAERVGERGEITQDRIELPFSLPLGPLLLNGESELVLAAAVPARCPHFRRSSVLDHTGLLCAPGMPAAKMWRRF